MGRRESKNFVILPGCITYKGWTRPRPVTPRSSSEWTPTSMAGIAVLADQVHLDAVLFCPGPRLSQLQVTDLMVSFGCFQPSFAEPPFKAGGLQLLFK